MPHQQEHAPALRPSFYSHMGLQLIEGIVPVFVNELWAIDGQLLVGIH